MSKSNLSLQFVLSKSSSKLTGLLPVVKDATIKLIEHTYNLGIPILITQGFRTYAQQNDLYAQGRAKSGKIVTNAKGGYSNHNFGVAIDFCLLLSDGKNVSWDTLKDGNLDSLPDWSQVVDVAKKLGFAWGGDWRSFKDLPHFEMTFGLTTEQYRAGKRPTQTQINKAYKVINKVEGENEPMTADEKKLFDELKNQVSNLKGEVESLTRKSKMDIPDYAEEAMEVLSCMKDKNGNAVVNTPNGRSADFYGVVTALYRAGVFDKE